jgi:hypothetical protein
VVAKREIPLQPAAHLFVNQVNHSQHSGSRAPPIQIGTGIRYWFPFVLLVRGHPGHNEGTASGSHTNSARARSTHSTDTHSPHVLPPALSTCYDQPSSAIATPIPVVTGPKLRHYLAGPRTRGRPWSTIFSHLKVGGGSSSESSDRQKRGICRGRKRATTTKNQGTKRQQCGPSLSWMKPI